MTEKTEKFIEKARQIHGDKYDYSKVEYVNAKTKVKIICPEHGVFEQTPDKHTGTYHTGCPKCAGNVAYTTADFIKAAKLVHGDLYDYSKVDYKGNKVKVEIRCHEHGLFWQTPTNHLSGKGCPKCANNVMLSNDEFIKNAVAVHGNFYDYSKVDYHGNRCAVEIVCPLHGSFWQIPYVHLIGCGCAGCGESRRLMNRDEEAIHAKAEKTFLERYGVTNPMSDPNVRQKQAESVKSEEVNIKRTETKRRNGSFNTSLCESRLKEMLEAKFGMDDVEYNYKSETYPFNCDFHIRSRDLYIELNAHWSHGKHWYSDVDYETVKGWRSRSKYYINAADTFSVRDVLKRKCAREANLNYVVFWKMDLSDAKKWFSLGCPDGHDWDTEYSWLK